MPPGVMMEQMESLACKGLPRSRSWARALPFPAQWREPGSMRGYRTGSTQPLLLPQSSVKRRVLKSWWVPGDRRAKPAHAHALRSCGRAFLERRQHRAGLVVGWLEEDSALLLLSSLLAC